MYRGPLISKVPFKKKTTSCQIKHERKQNDLPHSAAPGSSSLSLSLGSWLLAWPYSFGLYTGAGEQSIRQFGIKGNKCLPLEHIKGNVTCHRSLVFYHFPHDTNMHFKLLKFFHTMDFYHILPILCLPNIPHLPTYPLHVIFPQKKPQRNKKAIKLKIPKQNKTNTHKTNKQTKKQQTWNLPC